MILNELICLSDHKESKNQKFYVQKMLDLGREILGQGQGIEIIVQKFINKPASF